MQNLLDLCRIHILTTGYYHVFQAVDNTDIAEGIDRADIFRMEPLAPECLFRFRFFSPVA
ncbi:MAG: hypothetical protein A4E66_00489 [Syntrophus sp. PtaB.Bin001]|nr:MAG: hypothetical protein A4E66_00489 [Syntrophus sp. PtaB.Bin001]